MIPRLIGDPCGGVSECEASERESPERTDFESCSGIGGQGRTKVREVPLSVLYEKGQPGTGEVGCLRCCGRIMYTVSKGPTQIIEKTRRGEAGMKYKR